MRIERDGKRTADQPAAKDENVRAIHTIAVSMFAARSQRYKTGPP